MTVKRPTLVGATVDELIRFIEARELAAGDTLPSTSELAEQLDVSRTVVREAIAELAGQGLLKRRQGKDTTISFPGSSEFERLLRLRKALGSALEPGISEWRSVILGAAAALAARQATLADATRLSKLVASLREATSVDDVVRAEESFFMAIAEISGNEMMLMSIEGSSPLLRSNRAEAWSRLRRENDRLVRVLDSLVTIQAAIESRDPDGARAGMEQYLRSTSTVSDEHVGALS